ncbi:MAG TPA: PRC-barrel domain-containing protein, partial [Candidatus Thermoplasmatota archaeon]
MSLVTLSRRDATELPEGSYDVRDWEVRTAPDGEKVGKVDDMLLDEHGRPRYLDVDLGLFKRHVLVPLSEAHADPSTQVVWIDSLDGERLSRIPAYERDPAALSPDFETRLLEEYRTLSRGEDVRLEERERERE